MQHSQSGVSRTSNRLFRANREDLLDRTGYSRLASLFFPAAISLCGCAINTANFQTAESLGPGKFRVGWGISTGLHLEEVSYSRLPEDRIQKGGRPDKNRPYQRPLSLGFPDWTDVMDLSAISLHAGVGIGHGLEMTSSGSIALMAASGRMGLKYQLIDHAGFFHAAVNPTALFAASQGGSGPDDEITDGQQIYSQYILNDKSVLGAELPILLTWKTRRISYNLVPMLAYYNVEITKAFDPQLEGNYRAAAGGLSAGTYFRFWKFAVGPELSLVVLDPFGKGRIANVNYAFGSMVEF